MGCAANAAQDVAGKVPALQLKRALLGAQGEIDGHDGSP
jgi:hypothetical protein